MDGLSREDCRMLGFMAEHRMVLERQIAVLFDLPLGTACERLGSLESAGYAERWSVFAGMGCARILTPGLKLLQSGDRAPPKYNLGGYRHDIGVAWLWVLAQQGAFGSLAEVIGERRLRSEDMSSPDRPYSVRLGGYGATGREIRHYPDLLLVDSGGRRVALELELSRKEVPRRQAILAGYGADRALDAVVYFVERNLTGRRLARTIESEAGRMGISDRIHLRTFPPIGLDGREERGPREFGRSRGGTRGVDSAGAEAAR